ncbi:MAG: hypothetical protein ABT11_10435 [Novosphingobium sp. SCN 66-18]|nr:MAG: hypothetical protein ABT11_10435 [Novosphingobium sp. SCN 66-18]
MGFVRKGRSRIWIADHFWWATVVEFQPSSWSKGAYLNVAAHWLWSSNDFLSFDFGGRVEEHIAYASDEQFAEAADYLARRAAAEAVKLTDSFHSLPATAAILVEEERRNFTGGWMAYNAGMAAGIAGQSAEASDMFASVSNGFASPDSALAQAARKMATLLDQPSNFRETIHSLIVRHRDALALPVLSSPPL